MERKFVKLIVILIIFWRFYIANKSVGAKGFKATWTEVKDSKDKVCPPDMFLCAKSKYCISNQLTCNGLHNCGLDPANKQYPDLSDEEPGFCKSTLFFKPSQHQKYSKKY